jgi:hypothetical protein
MCDRNFSDKIRIELKIMQQWEIKSALLVEGRMDVMKDEGR